jgi:hypothetical protein
MAETRGSVGPVISLRDVVMAMDMGDAWTAYLNRHTYELVTITESDLELTDLGAENADLMEAQREEVARAREVVESEDYLELPSRFEIHEYSMMERFAEGVEEQAFRDALLRALRGPGAFRRFKDAVHERGLAPAWYAFRERALEQIAADWLEANRIAYRRD